MVNPQLVGLHNPWFHISVPATRGWFAIHQFASKEIETALGDNIVGIIGCFLTLIKFGYDVWKDGTKKGSKESEVLLLSKHVVATNKNIT